MKTLIKLITIIALALTLFSCRDNDYLVVDYPPETPWETAKQFEAAATYAYKSTFSTGWGGAYFMNARVAWDAMSDLLYMTPGTSENYPQDEVYYRLTASEMDRANECFGAAYAAINNINQAFDYYYHRENYTADGTKEHPFDKLSSSDIKDIRYTLGELYFIRAYAYYHLCMLFAPAPGATGFETSSLLPYKKDWTLNANTNKIPEFATAEKIFSTIILPDLDSAMALLNNDGTHEKRGAVNKLGAQFLAVKVYFQLKELDGTDYWTKAYNDFLANGKDLSYDNPKLAIDTNVLAPWIHRNYTLPEGVIFQSLYYDETRGSIAKDQTLFNWNAYTAIGSATESGNRCGWHVFSMSTDIAKKIGWLINDSTLSQDFLTKDSRSKKLFTYRLPFRTFTPDELEEFKELYGDSVLNFLETKYATLTSTRIWGNKYYRGDIGKYTNVPVFRAAEMYLTKAILEDQLGLDDKGLAEINTLRNARGLANLSSINADSIHMERIRELAFEGDRLNYLKALRLPIPAGDRKPSGDKYPTPGDIDINSNQLYFPIPLSEREFQNIQ